MKRIISKAAKICAVTCVGVFAVVNSGWCGDMPPVVSYQTNDPELKTYLTLFSSLEKELEGVLGKEFDAAEQKTYLENYEKNMLKGARETPSMQGVDVMLANAERMIDAEKRKPPRHHLAVLPQGADAKDSSATVFVQPAFNDQTLDQKFQVVSVAYKFSSIQELSEKAHAIQEKLRLVFPSKQGWTVQDSDAIISQQRNNITQMQNLQSMDQDLKRRSIELGEKNIKRAELGESNFMYTWKSDYNMTIGKMTIPASNVASVNILTTLEPVNNRYVLRIGMSRVMFQAKNK